MHADTIPWVDKAEGDFIGAQVLISKRLKGTRHLICFACQQSAEKYLKAFLVENNIPFSKTHALTKALLPLCEKLDPDFKGLKPYLEILDPYAVEFRYPGEEIPAVDARAAFKAAKKVRAFIRQKLDLGNQKRLL